MPQIIERRIAGLTIATGTLPLPLFG